MDFSDYLTGDEHSSPFDDTVLPDIPPAKTDISKCGKNCGTCQYFLGGSCRGCAAMSEEAPDDCEIYSCCVKKGHAHCGKCADFPCERLKQSAFDSDDGDNGDSLLALKDMEDSQKRVDTGRLRSVLYGACLGVLLGIMIGGITGEMLTWITAGTVFGTGLGLIFGISRNDK